MNLNDVKKGGNGAPQGGLTAGERALRVIDGHAHPERKIEDAAAYLCHMAGELRAVYDLEPLPEEALRPAVRDNARRLSEDCLQTIEGGAGRAAARGVMQTIIWRVGLLFAAVHAGGQSLPGDRPENLTRLIRELVGVNARGECELPTYERLLGLLKSAGEAPRGGLEAWAGGQLKALGYQAASPVRRYGHPIDSGLVRALDMELLNGAFRRFVDFNADRSMGQIVATSIPVTEENYPALNAIVDECVALLGIRRPYVIVTSHLGGLNAMTFGSDEEPYIAVTSLLTRIMTEAQMRFVIGHECGHIAMGHLVYHTAAQVLGSFSAFIPVVGRLMYSTISYPLNAWARRSEITADRAGLHCCGDPEVAKKTLLQLETAFNSAEDIDMDAYLRRSRDYLKGSFVRKLGEYGANHPMTPKRIEAIDLFARSALYYEMRSEPAPADAIGEKELARRTEKILSVL